MYCLRLCSSTRVPVETRPLLLKAQTRNYINKLSFRLSFDIHEVSCLRQNTFLKFDIFTSAKEWEWIELTSKQVKILGKVRENGKITNKELRIMLCVSRQAVLKEISKLADAGLIELVGNGRNAYYRFKDI